MVKQGTTDTVVAWEAQTECLEKRHPRRIGEHRERLPSEAVLLPSLGLCKTWPV